MSCPNMEQLLQEYVLGSIDAEEILGVESHLENCDACRNQVLQDQQTLSYFPYLSNESQFVEFQTVSQERVLNAVNEQSSTTDSAYSTKMHVRRGRIAPFAIGTAAILLLAGWGLFSQTERVDQQNSEITTLREAIELVLEHDSTTMPLVATDSAPTGVWGQVYTSPTADVMLIQLAETPIPKDSDYHCWIIDGEEYVNVGIVNIELNENLQNSDLRGDGWLIARKTDDLSEIIVTLEPKGFKGSRPAGETVMHTEL